MKSSEALLLYWAKGFFPTLLDINQERGEKLGKNMPVLWLQELNQMLLGRAQAATDYDENDAGNKARYSKAKNKHSKPVVRPEIQPVAAAAVG